ncbi:hypothetical protein TNIN_177861 [Trichonephila inaurata madagascariensis]|uniref:Uncharacterized protein n=1 Tax=Trichonephila inaurata madagascariensis TaxID=2747483 RepID=A0A8X6X8C1_9ARAC|nr:hypothetical protein TNIN_177861 [Trichonephila inaurata madagascariensis]
MLTPDKEEGRTNQQHLRSYLETKEKMFTVVHEWWCNAPKKKKVMLENLRVGCNLGGLEIRAGTGLEERTCQLWSLGHQMWRTGSHAQ